MISTTSSSSLKQKWSDSGLFALLPLSSLAISHYITWTVSTEIPSRLPSFGVDLTTQYELVRVRGHKRGSFVPDPGEASPAGQFTP